MNRQFGILVMITMAALFGPPIARAQIGDGARVREFIEQNAELLDVAASLVQETRGSRARSSLETARGLHEQSVSLLDKGTVGMAGRVALRAREAIQQTIAIAKRESRLEEQATRAIERATMRLDQARNALEESGSDDPAVRRLLRDATDHLRSAREQAQQQMFEVAFNLANSSTLFSMRALRLLRRDVAGPAGVVDEIERTERVIEELIDIRPTLHPSLLRMADESLELQRRARAGAAAGDEALAREQTLAARNLALRALRAAGPGAGATPDNAARAVTLTDEILERAREVAAEGSDRRTMGAVEQAARAQEAARHALEKSDYESALRHTSRARDVIRDALGSDNAPLDEAAVTAALARTDEVIADLHDALQQNDNPDARSMLQRARARQEEARHAIADGAPRRALALTRVAVNIARDGLQRLGDARP